MKSIFSKSSLFCLWQWLQGVSLSLSVSFLTFFPSVVLRRDSKRAAGYMSGSQSGSIIQLQLWCSTNYRNILQITHCTCKAKVKSTHLVDKKFKMSWHWMLTAQKGPCTLGCIKGSVASRSGEVILPLQQLVWWKVYFPNREWLKLDDFNDHFQPKPFYISVIFSELPSVQNNQSSRV